MRPQNRIATHPGEVLLHEFLEPNGQSQKGLARYLRISVRCVNELVRGKRGVTPNTAWLLAKAFKTSPEFWMHLQVAYDLSALEPPEDVTPITTKPPN